MAFQSLWGFDPDEVIKAQNLSRADPDTDESMYNADEQRAACILLDIDSQRYDLRGMFRL